MVQWFNDNLITSPELQKIRINQNIIILRKANIATDTSQKIQDLGTLLGHVRITEKEESYIAIPKGAKAPVLEAHEIPFAFLQCLSVGDYTNARKLLNFEISDEQLKQYFGEFEVLLNNYLEQPNLYSVLMRDGSVKTFTVGIEYGKITNIK